MSHLTSHTQKKMELKSQEEEEWTVLEENRK